ncbi:hypothetical protein HBI56_203350 [Parastagonospora nodorum]|uniref:Uncharacterized protein n=1 Tax=Phaeosphaeria nodorum (strain SN15 / ATCC MYA-4574 / FGSC 10173) TaxID=321614 RepID=A0A7U2FA67_PHANO|nr:hypothetical protein HBH56_142720 [Parastagonospora nodorum]QRD01547.1 hypothetical protein JI435_121930 [Parastagonospora nodorum SN15]KAH3927669.1 hypothetical protein HBH54_147910 [Parastagonospora nodorum]KAH3947978.1 hypothetical protein HBH53_107950 [Parastagonospora nodorum]KAH3962011.1 hypothetical protein HBH51_179050 [Parastagonospora nodorum]
MQTHSSRESEYSTKISGLAVRDCCTTHECSGENTHLLPSFRDTNGEALSCSGMPTDPKANVVLLLIAKRLYIRPSRHASNHHFPSLSHLYTSHPPQGPFHACFQRVATPARGCKRP